MIFKRILLILVLANLSACTSFNSFMNTSEEQAKQELTSEPSTTAEDTNNDQAATAETLSPEQELAIRLHAQSDLYQQSKNTLSAGVLSKISSILASYKAGEFENSQGAMNTLLQTELNLTSPVYVLAGDIELALDNEQHAMKHYKNALQLNQYNAKAANRLAKLLREQGQFEDALAMYTKAINAQPSHKQSYRNRAVLYDLYLNQKAKAFEDYQAYSALLHYQLEAQENPSLSNNAPKLADDELKTLNKDIKLVKRWLADVGRQVKALAKAQNSSQTNGK